MGIKNKEYERPSKDEFFLNLARENSKMATCLRRRFGAVIANEDSVLVSQGYAGAPRGTPNCTDLGRCFRDEKNVPAGKDYGLCRSVHAEMNAIINAGRERTKGGKLYLYGENFDGTPLDNVQPCNLCWRVIIQAGIKSVIVRNSGEIKSFSVEERVKALKKEPFSEFEISYS